MTHHITMLSGKVQQPGHAALRREFLALPDGEYSVRIAPIRSALPGIEAVAEWYNGLGESQLLDPALLDHLLPKSVALCLLLADFAADVNVLGEQSEGAALRLTIERNRLLAEAQAEAESSGKKFSVSAANVAINPRLAPLMTEESETAQAHRAAKVLLAAYNRILDRMNQQIGMLRAAAERERKF